MEAWVEKALEQSPWFLILAAGAWFFVKKGWPVIERVADAWIAGREKERLLLEHALNQRIAELAEKDKMLLVVVSDYKESVIGLKVEMEKWRRVLDDTLGLLRGQITPPFTPENHPGRRANDR